MVTHEKEKDKLRTDLIIAHRGVPYFAPEETFPAFQLASNLGADYLEADLQRTKDGIIIALHDNKLLRTTNIEKVFPGRMNEPVSNFTLSELQQLDAGSWFNETYPTLARDTFIELKIITLDELISIAEEGEYNPGLYLETKHPDQFPGIEADLKQLLIRRGWYQQYFDDGRPKVILQTFSPTSLELLHQEFPETPLCYLLWATEGCLTKVDIPHINNCLDFAQHNGAGIIGPSFSGEQTNYTNLLEGWIVDLIHSRGFQIHAYTFDTAADIKAFTPFCESQFTNRTDLLLDYYGRNHKPVEDILIDLRF